MKQKLLVSENNPRLIMFFAGWGMDDNVFASLSRPGYDLMLVYDYNGDDLDISALDNYEEIVVLAWSMGVFYANLLLRYLGDKLPFTKAVAVNGTLAPIDDCFGIPVNIYEATMRLPDQRAVDKFFRRICGGASRMAALIKAMPDRTVDSLRDELGAIREMVETHPSSADEVERWDEIIVSGSDAIFPPVNMLAAWGEGNPRATLLPDAAHAVDFQRVIDSVFVDKSLVGERFGEASATYDAAAGVQRQVAARTASIVESNLPGRKSLSVLEIGSGSGMLSKLVCPMLADSNILFRDLAPIAMPVAGGNEYRVEKCDAELSLISDKEESYDLIISSSTIQWFNSPRQSLKRMARALKPGGLAVVSFYAKGTFAPIDDIVGLRYPVVDSGLLESTGCDFMVEQEEVRVDYASARDALDALRSTGVNALRREPLGVASTREIMRRITNPDGSASLIYNVKYIVLIKKS